VISETISFYHILKEIIDFEKYKMNEKSSSSKSFNLATLITSYVLFCLLLVTITGSFLFFEVFPYQKPGDLVICILPLLLAVTSLFIGSCCILSKVKCCNIFFAICFFCFFAIQVVGVSLLATKQFDAKDLLRTIVSRAVTTKYQHQSDDYFIAPIVGVVDNLQQGFKCCGVDGPLDWKDANYNKRSQGVEVIKEIGVLSRLKAVSNEYYVPQSCCRSSKLDLCERAITEDNNLSTLFNEGCLDKISKFLMNNSFQILMSCSGIILLEIIIFISMFPTVCLK